jgi:hypothetical protein
MKGCHFMIYYLMLLGSIQLIRTSITVVSPTQDPDQSVLSPAPHVVFGRTDFTLTAELVMADPIDGCQLPTNNVTNKIVAYIFESCLTDIIMRNSIAANALGVIINGGDLHPFITYYITDVFSLGETVDIAAVSVGTEQWMRLEELVNSTSEPVIVKMTSGDFNVYTATANTPAFWVLHILLAVVAVTICIYGSHKLAMYIRFYGPQFSIAQVALSLLSLSVAASVVANIVVIGHFHYSLIPDTTYFSIYVSGPLLVMIATILVALYWSGLIFHKKQKYFWNKYLFGAVVTLLGLLFLLNIFISVFLRDAQDILLIIVIVIALIIGLYFIIIGGVLITRIIQNSRKINIVSNKKRYPQRLVKMLIVSGVSLVLFVIVSMLTQTPLYSLPDWQFFVLGMIQFFSMVTAAAEITLFKTITKDPKTSYSGSAHGAKSSVHSTSISSGTTEASAYANNTSISMNAR